VVNDSENLHRQSTLILTEAKMFHGGMAVSKSLSLLTPGTDPAEHEYFSMENVRFRWRWRWHPEAISQYAKHIVSEHEKQHASLG
jgi:hypothetical protein